MCRRVGIDLWISVFKYLLVGFLRKCIVGKMMCFPSFTPPQNQPGLFGLFCKFTVEYVNLKNT